VADLVVSVPSKRVSAWSVETNPKYARAWLASLSPVDNASSARELYQSLYTLNRMDLEIGQRLELMGLYRGPTEEASSSLQAAFNRISFPMSGKLRQLAEFICQLYVEMAYGYKLCVQDLPQGWLPWRRRYLLAAATERALYYLGEILLRSYQLYLPYPVGIWRDVYTLYGYAERHGRHEEQVDVEEKGVGIVNVSVSQRYRRLLILGVANPYQMPFGECATAYRFLRYWTEQVRIDGLLSRSDSIGCFLIDPTADAPPTPLGRATSSTAKAELRVLDTNELIRTLHVFLRRLDRGETAGELQLGVECLDSACHDMLQRLHRAYAQTASRRHSRIKRHETVLVCAGIGAVHFFASGQKPLVPLTLAIANDAPFSMRDISVVADAEGDEAYVALDEPGDDRTAPRATTHDSFRIDRWQVRDVSPEGLLLTQDGEPSVKLRVGDALGIQRTNAVGHWNVGIVRWFKAHGENGIEAGVELISPDAAPASLRAVAENETSVPVPVLSLPAVEAAHRPASLLAPRGVLQVGKDFFLAEADRSTRRVRILDAIERTGAVEQVVVGNMLE
jgi:hypothetical protein